MTTCSFSGEQTTYISYSCIAVTKTPGRNNVRVERFILAQSFRGLDFITVEKVWWPELVTEVVSIMMYWKADSKVRTRDCLKRHRPIPYNLLLQLLQTACQVAKQTFKT